MSDAFNKSWKIAKDEDEDDEMCENCITTDMSGKCTHCLSTPEEREKKYAEEDAKGRYNFMKKAMTDEEMVYVKMPKSMLPIIEMLSQNPEMWMHTGTDMGGDFAGLSRGRPSEKELFQDDWEMQDDERESLSGMDQYSNDFPYDLNYRLQYDRVGDGNYGESGFSYDHDRHGQRGRVERMNMMELLSRLANDEQSGSPVDFRNMY